ncbi:MAG: sigma-70 family RNA polymerase sigma factor [Kofleriaceae bacterium]
MDAIVAELEGLRALARALVRDDADDLIQDTAIAAIEHPPELDRPVRPWLARVLRNRWKMDRRAASRRMARELAVVDDREVEVAGDAIDRARAVEKLSAALVALEEPFRTAIVRRYFDGVSAADIARALDVPAGTVRWRIKTGLERLRAALDDEAPAWRRVLVPVIVKGSVVKAKTSVLALLVLLLALAGGVAFYLTRKDKPAPSNEPVASVPVKKVAPPPVQQGVANPLPGQGRALVSTEEAPGGLVAGRVINWSTGDGVVGAELTFASDAGAQTVRSTENGAFELAPPAPGSLTLATIAAPGFLPYAPEYEHSTIHVALAKGQAVRGLTVFLFPAIDYNGVVVDEKGAPVAGAHVKLLGTPEGEQQIDKPLTEWTSAKDGTFTFHAADDAVFEATLGNRRGWARLDGGVAVTHTLTIAIKAQPARDATIAGQVVDDKGQPMADVLVRALPLLEMNSKEQVATSFATTAADGSFTVEHLRTERPYELLAEAEGFSGTRQRAEPGAKDVTITLDPGVTITGNVVDKQDHPIPSFTLTVQRRQGAQRGFELARSIVDPNGHFAIHVAPGAIEVSANANGWAPSDWFKLDAKPNAPAVKLVVSTGGTLIGKIVDVTTQQGIPYARVMHEGVSGGASAQPANAGTVTRADGSFELTGLPPGPVAVTVGAGNYHPKIESGMVAVDGESIGPRTITLTPLAPGEEPTLELVGIGVALAAVDDGLKVTKVIPGGGAEAAGIVDGDLVVAVDGTSAVDLGVTGAVQKIRGAAGTTITLSIKRGADVVPITCTRKPLKA